MRNWIWISLLGLAVLLASALLLATPWAKKVVRDQAEDRGLDLEIADLSLGFLSAELKDATLTLEGVSAISLRLKRVRVKLSLSSPRIRSIVVDGGRIEINASIEELQEQLKGWKSRRGSGKENATQGGTRRRELARDLNIVWKNALARGETQEIRGLQLQRGPDIQRLAADLILLELGPLSGQIAGADLKMSGRGFELAQTDTLRAAEVRLTWRAPESTTKVGAKTTLPTTPLAATAKAPTSGASGLEERLRADKARVTRLLAGLSLVRKKVLPRLPPHTKVDRLWLSYLKNTEELHIGPSALRADKKQEGFRIAIEPKGDAQNTPLSFALFIPQDGQDFAASLSLQGGPVSLATLGIQEGAFGLQGVQHTGLKGRLSVKLSPDAAQMIGGGEVSISGLSLSNEKLSEQVVSFPPLHFRGKGRVAVDGTHYHLEKGELSLGEARFESTLDMERGDGFVSLKASIKAPLVSCQALLDSAPRGLLGAVERIRFRGTFSLDTQVEVDTRHLSKMRVHWDFKNGCRASAVPPELDPNRFRGSFRRDVVGAGNYPMEVEFGPLTTDWTPFDHVSPFMEKALLVTEDGRFYRHNGFDDRAIESSILANAQAGSFVRGASTISMQLAKNLYLSRKKTLSRKLREVALTSILEQGFEKKELLELYLNVVEFGPGVYGIRKAATHYFATTPQKLSAAQSFFLASILPLPSFEYFGADGSLSSKRRDYVNRLLEISKKRGGISEQQYDLAIEEVLRFGLSDSAPVAPAEDGLLDEAPSLDEFPQADPTQLTPPPPPRKVPAP